MPGPASHDDASGDGGRVATPGRRVSAPVVTLTLASAVTLVGMFGPWVRSGSSRRSSFELVDLVERLGFAERSLYAWTVRLWPLVPMVIVGAVVTAWAARRRSAAVLAAIAALYVGGVATGVQRAPDASLIGSAWGADVSVAGAACMLVGAVWVALGTRRLRPQRRQSPRSSIT